MLRLVHPAPAAGKDPSRPKGARSASLTITSEEAGCFRSALRNAARAYGGFPCLASAIGVPVRTLYNVLCPGQRPSGVLVLRVARAAGMRAEALISPTLSEMGRCSACGSRVAGGAA